MSKLQAARIKNARRRPAPAVPSSVSIPTVTPAKAAAVTPGVTPGATLQRARRLGHNVVQAKLTLGPADDPYERQADTTAKSVVQWLSAPEAASDAATGGSVGPTGGEGAVQRDEMEEDPDLLSMKRSEGIQRDLVQRDELEEDPDLLSMKRIDGVQREDVVQRDEDDELDLKRAPAAQRDLAVQRDEVPNHGLEGGTVDNSVEQAIDGARSGGAPLDSAVRAPMEQAFGADFGGVKIHNDSQSHELNRSLSARSFATGSNIFMGKGEYSPGTSGGQELLAHELTHVVQQGAAQAKRDDG